MITEHYRRYYDPYGNARGTAPSSFPVGEKGFVGGANDAATGLTNLGAREYQPGTGSFVSPDPLLKPYDPQNLNAYAYAAENPSTYSDPSGAMLCDPDHTCGSVQALDTHASAQSSAANPRPKGYSPTPSCPPTELTCTVPAPLTKAGRNSYQHPGQVKPAPVTARHDTKRSDGCPSMRGSHAECGNAKGLTSDHSGSWRMLAIGGLTILNLLQLGEDPFTDALEIGMAGLTDDAGAAADDEAMASLCGESFTADTKCC